jgi:hypothetical protein
MSRDPRNPAQHAARAPDRRPCHKSGRRRADREKARYPGCDALTGRDIFASAVLAYDGIHER